MTRVSPYQEDDASKLAGEVFGGNLSIEEALTKLRTRLLDLSMRNRLLNYRLPKGRSLQFTGNPDLDQIYEHLQDGKSVALAYVPDPPPHTYEAGKKPEARQYAKAVGISTSVDIVAPAQQAASTRVRALQTLFYPTDLERVSRKVSTEARTVVEEVGTNMLYLIFGFLEYYESDDSDKAVIAPLLSMPVALNKGALDRDSRTFTYELSHTGEDVTENFTLREKLRQLRLEMPEFDGEESPVDYLRKIELAIATRRNWKVLTRLTLGFLSFGKLAIWADLDPAKSRSLLSSELLRSIFSGQQAGPSDAFHAEDYDIDRHPDCELPLIYDADSSQHSAIIDVKLGKNLVINGPPGTGKSQTITNIIAPAIASGKKVLFVSEKLSALEVVKRRLERAGLGDFCLELHSHKTQKKLLLKNIEQRLSAQYAPPNGYAKSLEVLRDRRNQLNLYAQLLGARLGNNLDLTVHEIFWATERHRQALGPSSAALAGLTIPDAAQWAAERVDRCRKTLADAASALAQMGCSPQESPWIGFSPGLLVQGDEAAILQVAHAALEQAKEIQAASDELERSLPGTSWSMRSILGAESSISVLAAADVSLPGELFARLLARGLGELDNIEQEIGRLKHSLAEIRRLRDIASSALVETAGFDEARMRSCTALARKVLSERGLTLTPAALSERAQKVRTRAEEVATLRSDRPAQIPQEPLQASQLLRSALQAPDLAQLVRIPARDLLLRTEAARRVESETATALRTVQAVLRDGGVEFAGRFDEVERLRAGGGLHELLVEGQNGGATLDELRRLAASGWGEWTAGRFTSTVQAIRELLDAAKQAHDELVAFFARLGLPVSTGHTGLEAIGVLLAVAEDAPRELLALRGPGLERADIADVAINAEETLKRLAAKTTRIEEAFHTDSLPDDKELVAHIRVFRRGDGFFNFLKADWRAAKATFRGCSRAPVRLNAQTMADHFAAVHTWRSSVAAFEANPGFKAALGAQFEGMRTDFAKVRRLYNWVRDSQTRLLATDYAQYVNTNQLSEQHVAVLVASAGKLRNWLGSIHELSKAVKELPGLDPALGRARRVEDLYEPLEAYAAGLQRAQTVLSTVVRPTATVQRAVQLMELRANIQAHDREFRACVEASERLAEVAGPLGLPASAHQHRDLLASLQAITQRTAAVEEVAQTVAGALSAAFHPREAFDLLDALILLEGEAVGFLGQASEAAPRDLGALLTARRVQCAACIEVAEHFGSYVREATPLQQALAAAEASSKARSMLAGLAADPVLRDLLGDALQGTETDESAAERCLAWARQIKSVSDSLPDGSSNALLAADSATKSRHVARLIGQGRAAMDRYKEFMTEFSRYGRFDGQQWAGRPKALDAVRRLERAIAGEDKLVPWSKFLAAREDAATYSTQELIDRCEPGSLEVESLVTAFEFVFYRSLSRGLLSSHRELARFSGVSHDRLREEFAKLDKEVIRLTGQKYAAEISSKARNIPGVASSRVSELTEMALLTKEIGKTKRHVAIRQLLRRAGKALQEIKPCFMMGPLSVAQYLEQGHLTFDLIVMDEASQLRPEDALGAIARGKQLVVVGDPKQLPPTSFFDRLMEDDGEDSDEESTVVQGVESILGICEHLFRPVRTLRWHYRSQHESLIAFSNSQFYDHRLIVFPAPYQRNRRLGVNYRYVEEGVYQDRRNHPEAERVVDAVVAHMLSCPDESLMVVTLNQAQRELIEDLLDKRVRNLPKAADFLEYHSEKGWPFSVKNLENVQGDERDVIFISTTFGKPRGSDVVRQSFGPINRADGWRRLNVLFTRARRRVDLFTSMLPGDVKLEERPSLGRRALHDYLEYAKSGRLPSAPAELTEREEENDFEWSVAKALQATGFETQPQVGVAGYFIDLGVRHPTRRGEFLAGVECDGVTYHSSLSARDRDRIRQEVLESLGWRGRIIRVWSTDWFADPVAQTDRIARFLRERLRDDEASVPAYAEEDFETEVLEAAISEPRPTPESIAAIALQQQPATATIDDQAPTDHASTTADIFIELGDRVTFETDTDPPERHTIQIVDSGSNPKLGLLNDQTPVAQALMGLCEGDATELRVRGYPVRTMRIMRVER